MGAPVRKGTTRRQARGARRFTLQEPAGVLGLGLQARDRRQQCTGVGVPRRRVPVHRRNIGMLFQNYALFPHMTVAENIAFGLETRGVKDCCRSGAGRGCLAIGAAGGLRRPTAVAALRWSAAAGGAGPGAGRRTDAAVARRAARGARQEFAPEHADGTARAAAAARRHNGLRHPRPGRGADDGRPHCLHA